MRVYFIDAPYVSNGLSRTYKKKLEVFSGEMTPEKVVPDKVHRYLRGKWVEKDFTGSNTRTLYGHGIVYDSMPNIKKMNSSYTLFSSLEMAQAAKMVLIQRMAKQYEDKLQLLRETLAKNVPNVDKPLEVLKADYPEYFI